MKLLTSLVEDDVVLLEVSGDVYAHVTPELDRTLNDLLTQGHNRLLIDASRMDLISSAGLQVLVSAQRKASQLGGKVHIFGLNDRTRRVFEMAGLDECLCVCDTRQQAMEGW